MDETTYYIEKFKEEFEQIRKKIENSRAEEILREAKDVLVLKKRGSAYGFIIQLKTKLGGAFWHYDKDGSYLVGMYDPERIERTVSLEKAREMLNLLKDSDF